MHLGTRSTPAIWTGASATTLRSFQVTNSGLTEGTATATSAAGGLQLPATSVTVVVLDGTGGTGGTSGTGGTGGTGGAGGTAGTGGTGTGGSGAGPVTGSITRELWSGVSGTSVSSVPVNGTPSGTSTLTRFEAPTNSADNYGQRLRGYLVPPASGAYTFWIASDDNGELWLSSDATASNRRRIAYHTGWTNSREWNKFSTQKSAPVTLSAGQRYYVEAIMKEASGGDNLAVGWLKPGQTGTAPSEVIPGTALAPIEAGGGTGGPGVGGTGGTGGVPAGGGGSGGVGATGGGAPGGSGGAGSGTGGTTGAGIVTASVALTNDWGAGYCANVAVKNGGSTATTTWTVTVDLQGATVYSAWNYSGSQSGNVLTLKPVSWNGRIEPGRTDTSAGFCANRRAGSSGSATVLSAESALRGPGEADPGAPEGTACSSVPGERRAGYPLGALLLALAGLCLSRRRRGGSRPG